ncbi:MAG: putative oxidoreductase [Ilumatobacteraceae bacterium]|nr:putative oxidoreductase [Ilumatobacteraceae bacterium]
MDHQLLAHDAPPRPGSLVQAALEIGELVEAHADAAEQNRRLPLALVDALAEADLLRMCVPKVYGGPEADPRTLIEAIEAVAAADGAAGWCVMIASSTSSLSVFLDEDWARRIYGDRRTITGGTFAPNGTGTAVDGGWRASGRWMWGSGTQHCRYITGGTNVVTSRGSELHVMFFDADDVTIHDTWHTAGLRGTGSNDFSVDGAFVPTGRTLQPLSSRPTVDAPIAAFPNFTLLAVGVAAVTLGIARHALDEFADLAHDKRPQFSTRTLAQSGSVQAEFARTEASLRAARAMLLDEVDRAWATVLAGGRVDVPTRVRIRLAGAHAATSAAAAVDSAFTMAGGTAVFDASPLQRCLRDVHVATQHIMVAPRLYETVGKLLLGGEADTTMF